MQGATGNFPVGLRGIKGVLRGVSWVSGGNTKHQGHCSEFQEVSEGSSGCQGSFGGFYLVSVEYLKASGSLQGIFGTPEGLKGSFLIYAHI